MQAELAAGPGRYRRRSLTNNPDWRRAGEAADPYSLIPQLVVYQRNGVQARATRCSWSRRSSRCAPAARRSGSCSASRAPWRRICSGWRPRRARLTRSRTSIAARPSTPSPTRASSPSRTTCIPNVLVGFELPERRPVQWIVRHGHARAAGERQRVLPRTRRLRQPAAAGAGILGRHPALRVRGIARIPGPRRRPAAAVPHAGSRRPRCRPVSTGGCSRPSATRSRSGSRAPPSEDGAVRRHDADCRHRPGHGHQGSHRSRAEHLRRRALSGAGARDDSRPHRGT